MADLAVYGLDPAVARVGDPATTLRVRGAGFVPGAVIVWNDGDEPTTFVSPAEVTTIVNPATAVVATSLTVTVRNPDGTVAEPPAWFTFLDAGAALPPLFVDPADVLARLRMNPGSPDAGYVARCTIVANSLVWHELTRGDPLVDLARWGPPWPEPIWRAALGTAIRVYRFKDAESDVADTWGDTAPLRIPRDPVAGYRDMLTPYQHGSTWAPA